MAFEIENGILKKYVEELGVKDIDLDLLADNAMKDICAPGNPVEFTKEQIKELFSVIA